MIEETVQLAAIESPEAVWVRTQRQSTCGQCAMKSGCGTKVLSDYIGEKLLDVRALVSPQIDIASLTIGDHLVVGLPEQQMLKGTMVSYGLPLFGLFSAAIPLALFGAPDLTVALASMAGLMLGLVGVKKFANKIQNLSDWQPVVLRKATAEQPLKFVAKPHKPDVS
ncbi:MAG: SoxR reducing system RseC family protein [Gammaproteobacteria bacterium]|nr:SoxR reducing system RseC family protein [Gammaproteobacteria bacterium]